MKVSRSPSRAWMPDGGATAMVERDPWSSILCELCLDLVAVDDEKNFDDQAFKCMKSMSLQWSGKLR